MSKTVRLYIVRHGETEFNIKRKAQGWCDSPLTQNGIDIAKRLGKGIKDINFTGAYSSDLGRAKNSLEIILEAAGKNIPMNIHPGLKERGMGSLEGNVVNRNPWDGAEKKALADGFSESLDIEELSRLYEGMAPSGGIEPLEVFRERLFSALNDICEAAPAGLSEIIVVSHGMAILGMIHAITKSKYVPLFIINASVSVIEWKDGAYDIIKVNDTSYIED